MEQVYPFGFPLPTATYLCLYVLTLVVHVVFMNYVFAGSGYVAWSLIRDRETPMAAMLRDWLPFALGATITAGVAPLLFLQILYKQRFYTANLLLFHRWMAILPVLIAGFYLLYLLKNDSLWRRGRIARSLIGIGAFLSILFTGYSWTENHLLSLNQSIWPEFYLAERMLYWNAALLPRVGTWLIGSVPTMVVIVSWQLLARRRKADGQAPPARHAGYAAIGSGLLALICAETTYLLSAPDTRRHVLSTLALPYLLLAAAGAGLQGWAWITQIRKNQLRSTELRIATIGALLTIGGMTVVREALRLADLNVADLYELHARAAEVGGFYVFLIFATINSFLIVLAFILVARNFAKNSASTA